MSIALMQWERLFADGIVNGGFEQPAISGNFVTLPPGSTALPGWTIEAGSVDVCFSAFQPAEGAQSLDLDGFHAGTISQSFSLSPGTYVLSFQFANNYESESASALVEVTGTVGESVITLLEETISHSGSARLDMNYSSFNMQFSIPNGANTQTLRFTSLSEPGSPYGVALDAIDIARSRN